MDQELFRFRKGKVIYNFWNLVGLCSYLLINFWYTRIQANKAAIMAMVINRIGDLGLTLGILAVYFIFETVDFATIFALAPHFKYESTIFWNIEINNITLISTLFLIGVAGKSAQLGLHTWLPSAMEGSSRHIASNALKGPKNIGPTKRYNKILIPNLLNRQKNLIPILDNTMNKILKTKYCIKMTEDRE